MKLRSSSCAKIKDNSWKQSRPGGSGTRLSNPSMQSGHTAAGRLATILPSLSTTISSLIRNLSMRPHSMQGIVTILLLFVIIIPPIYIGISFGVITRESPSKISSTVLYCSHANAIGLGIVITEALFSSDLDNLRTNFRLVISLFLTRQLLVIIIDT